MQTGEHVSRRWSYKWAEVWVHKQDYSIWSWLLINKPEIYTGKNMTESSTNGAVQTGYLNAKESK